MLLYDVFYCDKSFDREIPLPKTAEPGTRAVCKNGQQDWYHFTKNEWINVDGQTARFDEINNRTGFANGDYFDNADEVREYFARKNMRLMFSNACSCSNDELADMLADVLANHWHCRF